MDRTVNGDAQLDTHTERDVDAATCDPAVNHQHLLGAGPEGRAAEAIPLLEQTLATRQRMLGPEDPETLTSQDDLASAYQDAGRTAEAIRLYELNLEARQRLLDPDHPSTLNSRGNLAAAYRDAGRVAEAIALLKRTSADRERVLGPDHPDSQASRKNLADAYRAAGRAAEAIPLETTLADRRDRVLGPDHPDTRASPKNLATAYQDGGWVDKAPPPPEQTFVARESQPPGGQRPPVGFRRPPADSARQPPAKLTDHSSSGPAKGPPPKDVNYDREVVAAIRAGDPAGIAMAYDRYAAPLYGYCHWMLHDPACAAEALQGTFVVAATTPSDFPETLELRPWLYAVAHNECQRRIRTTPATRDEEVGTASQRADAAQPTGAAARSADATNGDARPAGLQAQARSILAELKPREREVIELSFRHDLYDNRRGVLRPEAFSRLLPLAPLPPELRDQVLSRCTSNTEDAVAYRGPIVRRAESIWSARFSQAIRHMRWESIRANPGPAIAAVAVTLWVVAAVSAALLTFAGSHAASAEAAQPTVGTSSSRPAAAAIATAAPTSAAASPSPTTRQPPAYVPSPVQRSPSPPLMPSPVLLSSPTASPSPTPSKSASSSPKPSKSPSPSRTPSPSPSASSSASPSPSSSATP